MIETRRLEKRKMFYDFGCAFFFKMHVNLKFHDVVICIPNSKSRQPAVGVKNKRKERQFLNVEAILSKAAAEDDHPRS